MVVLIAHKIQCDMFMELFWDWTWKGQHDGASACIKNALRGGQRKFIRTNFQDAKSIVKWCTIVMGEQSTRKRKVRMIFSNVKNVDHSHTYQVNTVHGAQGFYSFRSLDNSTVQIWTRNMSCFCGSCSTVEWDECQFSEWVDTWDQVTLNIDTHVVNEIKPLEEHQTKISID